MFYTEPFKVPKDGSLYSEMSSKQLEGMVQVFELYRNVGLEGASFETFDKSIKMLRNLVASGRLAQSFGANIAQYIENMRENNHTNLLHSNLEGADLSKLDLSLFHLHYSNLKDANLTEANLKWSRIQYANLARAALSNSILTDCHMVYCNLKKVDFKGANLFGYGAIKCDLSGADFSGTNLRKTHLTGNLDEIKLKGAEVDEKSYLFERFVTKERVTGDLKDHKLIWVGKEVIETPKAKKPPASKQVENS